MLPKLIPLPDKAYTQHGIPSRTLNLRKATESILEAGGRLTKERCTELRVSIFHTEMPSMFILFPLERYQIQEETGETTWTATAYVEQVS